MLMKVLDQFNLVGDFRRRHDRNRIGFSASSTHGSAIRIFFLQSGSRCSLFHEPSDPTV